MVKKDCLLVLTLVLDQIIGCDGEERLSAHADPCVIQIIGYNGEERLSAADPIPDHWLKW